MRGVGAATGAITIVNALFTGTGCAAAVSLPVRAELEAKPSALGSAGSVWLQPACDTALARASLLEACRRLAGGRDLDLRLTVESTVPVSKGLKSSSAVSVAISRSVASALHVATSAEAEARASADVSRAIGLSATGAFDDAFAAAAGGIAVTDNRLGSVTVHAVPPADCSAVVWVPEGTHEPSPRWQERFRRRAGEARRAVEAATRGDWLTAMENNTELVEQTLGINHRPLRRELERLGALSSGISGLGPALASIVPHTKVREFVQGHPAGSAHLLVTDFTPPAGAGDRRP